MFPFTLPLPPAEPMPSKDEVDKSPGSDREPYGANSASEPAEPAPEPPPEPPDQAGTPLVVEHLRLPERPGHYDGTHFRPAARVWVTPVLRTSGLLAWLPDEATRTLLAVLTFVTPNGRIQPTTWEVAEALKIPEPVARKRVHRLADISWQGTPLVQMLGLETARTTVILTRSIVSPREALPPEATWEEQHEKPTRAVPDPSGEVGTSWRDQVVAGSRARHGTPRAEAERLVMEQLGYPREGNSESEARRKLQAFGISASQADALLGAYPLDRIHRQIDWMGMRQARDPARFLIAAIANDYGPPEYVRNQRRKLPDLPDANPQERGAVDGVSTDDVTSNDI